MNDQQRIAQINSCLDNETPIGISLMREGLWAFRRENEELNRKLNPPLATGLEPLKGTQARVYDHLASYIAEHGYSPSQREIAEAVGLVSSSTVNGHLERLEKAGYIDRNGGKPRAIKITGARESVK